MVMTAARAGAGCAGYGDPGQDEGSSGGEPAHLPQRRAHQHLVQPIECHVSLGTGAGESLHPSG
ncbi:hypothetical protein SAMN04489832_0830 [Micromonospora cremea]|uniref:Uncharacterized protein n=1 Tax=Micromonospora cremea TaxID=709881 RepID=A0A1N5UFC2_9ACTN|nr:hypothetical protein SAMN04489832_0830 [Micromonospora cremea]